MELNVPIESVLDALREVVRTYAGPGESHALVVRRGLIDAGRRRVGDFSWDEAARRIAEVYRAVAP